MRPHPPQAPKPPAATAVAPTAGDPVAADQSAVAPSEPVAAPPAWAPTCIRVRGARTHNLRNIDLDLPKHALVVITGVSGSGKSSLAFDTLYAEGQRRYVESLSAYARQFLQRLDKPDVDRIEGLSPAIAIEQKATSHNPRSTVGTVTEIHDYLRVLFARVGTPHCPTHGTPLAAQTVGQMVDALLALPAGARVQVLAPLARRRKGAWTQDLGALLAQGFVRFRIDGRLFEAEALPSLEPGRAHDMDVVVDRVKVRAEAALRQRLAESLETALRLSDGQALALVDCTPQELPPVCQSLLQCSENESTLRTSDVPKSPISSPEVELLFSARHACVQCGWAVSALSPALFSFNAPQGACPRCDGLGEVQAFEPQRVVAHPQLSLAAGALVGWDRRNADAWALIQALAAHAGFDPETAWQDLSAPVQALILHGSGDAPVTFAYRADAGRRVSKSHPFEGVLATLERRWQQTDSALVREQLASLRSSRVCPECAGARLREAARHVRLGSGPAAPTLHGLATRKLADLQNELDTLHLSGARAEIAQGVLLEVRQRLRFLNDVGLGYLSLARSADTLSGGEAQRIRLASQIGSGLSGVMYVLDEPSIGLHPRDNSRLIATLQRLRDLGNSVLVVEHDEEMMRAADYLIDLGPGAGEHGGRLMAAGTPAQVCATPDSPTGAYLSGHLAIPTPAQRVPVDAHTPRLGVRGARGHTLQNLDVDFPLGRLIGVTGVSGSGKSTLVNDTLLRSLAQQLHGATEPSAPLDQITGLANIDKVIAVDQSPIGRTPRSNPATYTGLLTPLRELLAQLPSARERGYGPGRFSFNVAAAAGGGRCEACQGDGVIRVEMHFLPDVYVRCDVCAGARFNRETLEVRYRGLNIAQILDLTVAQALAHFDTVPTIARKLRTLIDVGLGYLRLGQSAPTLSGGEAQRVKLALELSKRDTGRTLYVLDEPTTGLHFADIALLLRVLMRLRDAGNTVLVIEHNLDVLRCADWLIDLGPEGGDGGGRLVAQGTPEHLAQCAHSHTGRALQSALSRHASS